jgi:hypothetical protein
VTKPEVGKPASFTDIAFDSGVIWERERHAKWLERVRTWNPEKSDNWLEGYEAARNHIVKTLEERAEDLENCGKTDDCAELAHIVRVCIEDILDKETT